MEDAELVALFWQRDETALQQTEAVFERYLTKIAENILHSVEDARECVNDTLLAAWNGIPPAKPERLGLWLGRITRQYAIDRYRRFHAEKRRGSLYAESLDELGEIVSGTESPEDAVQETELRGAIERYLKSLPNNARIAFVKRYFEVESLESIAKDLSLTASAVKSLLWRTRQGLKKQLLREGYSL